MKRIILLNKSDLTNQLDLAELNQLVGQEALLPISVLASEGMDQLEEGIAELFFDGGTGERDATYVSNNRHIALLEQGEQALVEVVQGIEAGMPVDLVQIDMTRCWDLLGEVIGESVQDELITQLFSQFCLGK